MNKVEAGIVYLVGAGPGAADLLTVRAARLLREADIVFHDSLIGKETLALASRAVLVPVGKRSARRSTAQHFINKRLLDAARRYRTVVRLKGGDPMLFGRAYEEISFLTASGVTVEVVPGVTAALAAAAELGVSLTRRGLARSVAFVTPRVGAGERPSSWVRAVVAADSAAIYMGAGEAASIAAALIEAGKQPSTPVAIVEDASLPSIQSVGGKLEELPALAARIHGGPALILIGEVFAESAVSAVDLGKSDFRRPVGLRRA